MTAKVYAVAQSVPEECDSCQGLNTSCPDGCERDPKTGELLPWDNESRASMAAARAALEGVRQ